MKISIIIPAINEAEHLPELLNHLLKHKQGAELQILVSDGGSTDDTIALANSYGVVVLHAPKAGRAAQMHYATQHATGDLFYFVHADTLPPTTYVQDILKAVQNGYDIGRYQTRYNTNNRMLLINAWFTRFDWFICLGGDQTLFITRICYQDSGGFNTTLSIMEEFEFVPRVRLKYKYLILPGKTLVSARKYEGRSWLQVQLANRKAIQMFKKGVNPDKIRVEYHRMLNSGK